MSDENFKYDDPYDVISEASKLYFSINKKNQTAIKNFNSIPKNATIKLEWVKCGKKNCRKCSENEYYHLRYGYHHPHGPYFYAYFRDVNNHRKLKKKYIGDCNPRSIECLSRC